MLAAAQRLFLLHGYQQTSVNDLIRESGGSKATLVALFGNKAGLFAAVIGGYAATLADAIARTDAEVSDDVRGVLTKIGVQLLQFYLRPDALQVYRGVIQAGPLEPAVAQRFYNDGHQRIVVALAAVLHRWQDMGVLRLDDPLTAADRYTHLLRHGLYEQCLIGLLRRPSVAAIRAQAAASANAFLDGHSAR